VSEISGKKILVTGASGTVARPAAEALAKENEVWCIGRFGDAAARDALESQGMTIHRWDMANLEPLEGLPTDFTHVMHSAVLKGVDDWQTQIEVNGGATAMLMLHCRDAEAFLFVSSSTVYQELEPEHLHTETDPLGGESAYMPFYTTQKIGTEAVVRSLATAFDLPSTIARLSVTYGPYGYGGLPARYFELMQAGTPMPISEGHDDYCMPLHTDDVARQVPLLWGVAEVPATVVNWGGDEVVGQMEIMEYISELTGVPATFEASKVSRRSHAFDNTRRISLIGQCEVDWHDGVRRTLEARFPGAVRNQEQ
jgi:UDP-glucuronate 4-epimerase